MKKDLWSYLDNPFNNVTKGNFKRMIMMVQDHRDKLKRAATLDPAISNLTKRISTIKLWDNVAK
jgi:hypothetical protein